MGDVVVQLAGLAALGLAVSARARSSPERLSAAFWVVGGLAAFLTLGSPVIGVLAASIALLGARCRNDAFGALVALAALVGIAGMAVGSFVPVVAAGAPVLGLCCAAGASAVLVRSADRRPEPASR